MIDIRIDFLVLALGFQHVLQIIKIFYNDESLIKLKFHNQRQSSNSKQQVNDSIYIRFFALLFKRFQVKLIMRQ